ncbi:DUF3016 domain-containing protein [Thalassotalea mangrovi]|uniref:DUF3016 domain-containing protein n=1 Tax=Thalassotalea mangrovi TaxID=2572245 RepID=A0A4U1B9U3_9GAMM|nr:DUF3016 domain-containing protein [Thalassotalea mangrovi]TKB47164.1 DUF3016 domain-containing protein [Thalassotalea mangrovi]
MNKWLMVLLAPFLISCSSTSDNPEFISATERGVTVTLLNPDDFSDIEAGNMGTQPDFEQSVANKLAEALADHIEGKNITIEIKFTDIDLAGETRFNFQEIRVLDDLYIPRMSFEYVIKDATGEVVTEDTANIKEMGYLTRTLFGSKANEMIGYDKRLLVEYFDKVLNDHS